jgi:hypothetical protein
MKLIRTPQLNDNPFEFSVDGDVLTINGEPFDFTSIPEGNYIERVPCVWIVGPVWREGGEINLTLIEPYGPPNPEEPEGENVEA